MKQIDQLDLEFGQLALSYSDVCEFVLKQVDDVAAGCCALFAQGNDATNLGKCQLG